MKRESLALALICICGMHTYAFNMDVTVKSRLEGAYNSIYNENENEYGFGLSSLYTFLEGDITDNLSYYASLHLLSSSPAGLYDYEAPCLNGTWVDMAYLSYNRDLWGIDLGKVNLNMGGIANEYDDVDCYSGLVPYNWNEFTTYQYGATLRLTPGDYNSFELQVTTSPYMESFDRLNLAYGLCWRGDWDGFSTSWAVNSISDPESTHLNIGLGNKFNINDRWNIEMDAFAHLFDCQLDGFRYSDFTVTGNYIPAESLSLKAMLGVRGATALSAGALVEYYPIESLRLHASFNYCDCDRLPEDFYGHLSNGTPVEASIGVTYTLDFGF